LSGRDSQRSHLSSFTMKLMDKFHSPKIKRTPSKKGKQHQPEPAVKSTEKPVNRKVSRLEEQEKEVVSALRYFKTIVDKMAVDSKVLQMLPGSASKVLEAILPLVQVEARIQHSSAIASCHNRVYQSLANLIRWSDQVMLEGIDLDDKDTVTTVTTVIKAVLDGVKVSCSEVFVFVYFNLHECEMPLTEREKEILNKTTPIATPTDSLTDISEEEVAPPKPPLPGLNPPALPPKKRQSAHSPTRVAIVAPMSRTNCGLNLPPGALKQEYEVDLHHRRFSGGSQSYGGDSPRLSPCSSMGKLSKSDEQLSSLERDSGQCSRNTSCETLEGYDPDYDFLHQDLSVSEPLPFPTVHSGCLSPLPESLSESPSPGPTHPRFSAPLSSQSSLDHWTPPSTAGASNGEQPPALPQKKRRSVPILSSCPLYERLPSHYDNLQEEDTPTPPFPLVTPVSPGLQCNGSEAETPSVFSDSPPPLPEKKSKTILQYMQFVEDYSEPQPSVFYQTPQSERIYEQRRNKHFQEVYGIHESYSSSDSVHEPAPPPALPPKQRQLSESANDEGGEGEYVNLYSATQANGDQGSNSQLWKTQHTGSVQNCILPCLIHWHVVYSSLLKSTDSGHVKEDVDELTLVDHKEIMNRITLKTEGDDGPDVRAGSSDILLVHATETDRKDLVLYCEAFLTTYRTFITPEDLIKKLHYRYPLLGLPDTFKKRVSKNTFFVLVRVVDELCLVELTEDILRQLMELVFRLVCNGELSLARVLRKNILDKVEQKRLLRHTHILKPLAARGVSARPGTLHDFRSHEIADQLTLLDAELFYKIEIPEVLLWAKEQNEEKSPNLTQFTEHFNNMSYWVRSIIIQQEKAQDREKLLLKFIKIMKHLRKLNNFNSYLAILSALDSAPIRRLEWQKQTSEGLEEYCTLIDSSSSFRAYRAALADVEPPCIPYLGLILQDLTFVHLGNPDLIDGKVNFSKRWQQFNILDSMRRFQQVHYELKRNEDIISFFNDFSDHLAEEALWELSLKIKPRNITRRKTEREEKT
uniref:CRK SH3-binding GNRP n=1 Tax=Pygocentrus nattereri TaxID=42514 RepID=A0AAR2K5T0_PYGNA